MEMLRCGWSVVGRAPCGRTASHVWMRGGEDGTPTLRYFCDYHAGVARRDGWTGLRKLVPA